MTRLRPLCCLLAAAAGFAAHGEALAATPSLQSTLRFTEGTPGVSTGIRGTITNGSAARRPSPAHRLTIALPAGSAITLDRAFRCTAAHEERVGRGHGAVCPPETRIGTGRATIIVDGDARTAELELWNVAADGRSVVSVEQRIDGERMPPMSATASGRTIAVPLPGTVLTRLTLSIPAIGGEDEWNKDIGPLITTPARCPRTRARSYVLSVAVTSADGRRRVARSRSRCG